MNDDERPRDVIEGSGRAGHSHLRELAIWLLTLDDPIGTPGGEERRRVTLTQIIERARAALAGTPYHHNYLTLHDTDAQEADVARVAAQVAEHYPMDDPEQCACGARIANWNDHVARVILTAAPGPLLAEPKGEWSQEEFQRFAEEMSYWMKPNQVPPLDLQGLEKPQFVPSFDYSSDNWMSKQEVFPSCFWCPECHAPACGQGLLTQHRYATRYCLGSGSQTESCPERMVTSAVIVNPLPMDGTTGDE